MASYNRVILVGNVTRDPEIRHTPSQLAVTDLGLAVNERRKNQSGEWTEETVFVDVTLWGRQAEVAGEYLSKGSPVLIEGKLRLDTWETPDGQKRSKLKVVGERMQMLGSRGGGGGGGGGSSSGGRSSSQGSSSQGNNGGSNYGSGPSGGGGQSPQSHSQDDFGPTPGGGTDGDGIPF
jgi:single-strand DNA-binding protein